MAKAVAETGPSIRDLRDLLWASIDNDDSRDLDQFTVASARGRRGEAFSSQSPMSTPPSRTARAVDGHARTNTTSVYTAAGIFPMLPERLSTDLTSLAEGRERLAIAIEMAVAADGTVTAPTSIAPLS